MKNEPEMSRDERLGTLWERSTGTMAGLNLNLTFAQREKLWDLIVEARHTARLVQESLTHPYEHEERQNAYERDNIAVRQLAKYVYS